MMLFARPLEQDNYLRWISFTAKNLSASAASFSTALNRLHVHLHVRIASLRLNRLKPYFVHHKNLLLFYFPAPMTQVKTRATD
jgi:hypothetical protein